MIFLLSDGKPTDGYWQTIHSEFEKLNRDVESVVFSFAIGSRSPFDDLEKISLRSGGVARKLEDSTDISVKLSNFYLEIAVPIIWNLQERDFYFILDQSVVVKGTYFDFHIPIVLFSNHLK